MTIEIQPMGDRTLLVNFAQKIDPDIHQQVMNLSAKIEGELIEGVLYISPAYCSLSIGYNPEYIKYPELSLWIKNLWKQRKKYRKIPVRVLTLPVCYEEPYALDLWEISKITGLMPEDIIETHIAKSYQVYMLGFLPGFPYLGVLPEVLQCPRKAKPRLATPERSVGIAGLQTGIYPSESPGGWNIVGNTPLPIFTGQKSTPFLLRAGDEVKFQSITKNDYEHIEGEIREGTFNWDMIYE